MPTTPAIDPRNEDQRVFWNDGPGRSWVELRDALDRLHAGIGDAVLDAADPRPGDRALDIGCGAGATSRAVARRVAPDGHVTGIDISDALLDAARAQPAPEGAPAPVYLRADAQVWRPDAPQDLVLSRMGVMFFADPPAAFVNIRAMLRQGGRLAFICWRGRAENPWFDLPQRAAEARLGPAPPGDPDAPGPMAFRDTDRVRAILAGAGIDRIEARGIDLLLDPGGDAGAAARLATAIGPATRHIRDMGGTEADRAAIAEALRADFARFETGGRCRVPARMNLFTARRPG